MEDPRASCLRLGSGVFEFEGPRCLESLRGRRLDRQEFEGRTARVARAELFFGSSSQRVVSTPVRKTGFDKPRNPAAPVRLAKQCLAAAEAAYKARAPSKVCQMCLLLEATFQTVMVCVGRQPFVVGDGAVGKARDDADGEGGGAGEGQKRGGSCLSRKLRIRDLSVSGTRSPPVGRNPFRVKKRGWATCA